MRPAGNLAGVAFIDAPIYHGQREEWREIISGSGYFFTVDAMRWFRCRVAWDTLTTCSDGYAFITSEQDSGGAWDGRRRYTVRKWDNVTGIDELSEFGEFATLATAKRHLTQLTDN